MMTSSIKSSCKISYLATRYYLIIQCLEFLQRLDREMITMLQTRLESLSSYKNKELFLLLEGER